MLFFKTKEKPKVIIHDPDMIEYPKSSNWLNESFEDDDDDDDDDWDDDDDDDDD